SSLPDMLRKKPELKYKLYEILEEHFPPRQETNRLLEEIQKSREETNLRFEEMNKRFEERFEGLVQEMNLRFEGINRRFEEVNTRFEGINRRFEEMNTRFEDLKSWVQLTSGRFQARAGLSLEETISGVLRVALHTQRVTPEKLKLRQKIVDNKGLIGKPNREYEYDIFISDDQFMIFEVKSAPDVEDVVRFADKCELVINALALDEEKVKKVLVTLAKELEIANACIEHGIILC
ncbi:MAG: hypothetical protein QME68_01980, partial [Elusimicrobiota bacterium]|nr:hypothetical protein [Elusimicrobiota bacterium]